jgi:carbamoyl-phosphate synthase large subunit
MTPRVLIVGGGVNQLELVRRAKLRGCWVAVSDINENPPCRAEADEYYRIDTTDKVGTYRAAQSAQITAVVTDQSDVAVPTAAYIAEQLGLPGIGFETSLRFTNKYLMRQAVAISRQDLLPESRLFESESELLDHLGSPGINHRKFIVKPLNSQGSKGVARLEPNNYRDATSIAFRESRGHGVLLEEFVEGDEFSVETFVVVGAVHNLAVTRKFHFPQNDCIDYRNTYLGDIPLDLENSLYSANAAVVALLGLKTGSTHGEYKVCGDRVVLMEIAARGGGGNISGKVIPFLTEFSPTDALLDFALGTRPKVRANSYRNKFAVLRFFDFPPGRVERVSYELIPTDHLLYFELNLRPRDVIRVVRSSRDRIGYFIVGADSREQVLLAEKSVLEAVSIKFSQGWRVND